MKEAEYINSQEGERLKALAQAVIKQLGGWELAKHYFMEISNNGRIISINGFTLHSDTTKFFDEQRDRIICAIGVDCHDMGVEMVSYVTSFHGILDVFMEHEVRSTLFGDGVSSSSEDKIKNVISIYAVAFMSCNYRDMMEKI